MSLQEKGGNLGDELILVDLGSPSKGLLGFDLRLFMIWKLKGYFGNL